MPIFNYDKNKQKLIMELIKFNDTDNLMNLANALIVGKKILLTNHFPIGSYKKYVKMRL